MRNSVILRRLFNKYGRNYVVCLLNTLTVIYNNVKIRPRHVAFYNIFEIYGSINHCLDICDTLIEEENTELSRDDLSAIRYSFTNHVPLWVNNYQQFTDVDIKEMIRTIHDMLNIYEELLPISDMVAIGLADVSDGKHSMPIVVAFGIFDNYYDSIQNAVEVVREELGNVTIMWRRVVPSESQYEKLIRMVAEKYEKYGDNNGAGTYHII